MMRRRAQGRPNLRIVREPTNSGGEKLIGSLRHAIKSVQTPYTCSVQHDLAFTAVRSIDFEAIVADMQNATFQMKYVLFSRFPDTWDHDVSYHFDRFARIGSTALSVRGNHSYARTATWSDNNHLASTEYLATLYDACTAPFPEWCMMEAREKPAQVFQETSASERARLIGARQQDFSWENFGAWWYHPAPGTSRSQQEHVALHHQQIFHVDGRQSETCAEVKVCAEVKTCETEVVVKAAWDALSSGKSAQAAAD